MDTNAIIHPVSGVDKVYQPLIKTNHTDQTSVTAKPAATTFSDAVASSDNSASYEEAITKLSSTLRNFYALGDTQFTIFKDSTGQFITRYFSLRDGSVTYVPHPVLLRQAQSIENSSLQLAINA